MNAVYIRISYVTHFDLPTSVCSFALRHGCILNTIPKQITDKTRYMQSDHHYAVQPDSISLNM